jgi:hypothetical protein
MDYFLSSFVAALNKNEADCERGSAFPAHAKPAVKVLVCAKSIAARLGMTHVSSAFLGRALARDDTSSNVSRTRRTA